MTCQLCDGEDVDDVVEELDRLDLRRVVPWPPKATQPGFVHRMSGTLVRGAYHHSASPANETRVPYLSPRISARSYVTGSSSCSNVHERGSRSGRHRTNWPVWRRRGPSMWSYLISTTRSGRSGTKVRSLPEAQRLPAECCGVRVPSSSCA